MLPADEIDRRATALLTEIARPTWRKTMNELIANLRALADKLEAANLPESCIPTAKLYFHRITSRDDLREVVKLMSKPAIHVSEAEAASDFPSLLARVRAGAEVVIERNAEAVAVLRPAAPNVRLLSESLHLVKERGPKTTLDGDFGRDLEAVVTSHREPLTPPAWD